MGAHLSPTAQVTIDDSTTGRVRVIHDDNEVTSFKGLLFRLPVNAGWVNYDDDLYHTMVRFIF